jgi:hypothetical protein
MVQLDTPHARRMGTGVPPAKWGPETAFGRARFTRGHPFRRRDPRPHPPGDIKLDHH